MPAIVVAHLNRIPVLLFDSLTRLRPDHAGAVVVAGCHAGLTSTRLAIAAGLAGVVFNSSGQGLEPLAMAALAMLDDAGMPGATCGLNGHALATSRDVYSRGIVGAVNGRSRALGIAPGMSASAAAARMGESAAQSKSNEEGARQARPPAAASGE